MGSLGATGGYAYKSERLGHDAINALAVRSQRKNHSDSVEALNRREFGGTDELAALLLGLANRRAYRLHAF